LTSLSKNNINSNNIHIHQHHIKKKTLPTGLPRPKCLATKESLKNVSSLRVVLSIAFFIYILQPGPHSNDDDGDDDDDDDDGDDEFDIGGVVGQYFPKWLRIPHSDALIVVLVGVYSALRFLLKPIRLCLHPCSFCSFFLSCDIYVPSSHNPFFKTLFSLSPTNPATLSFVNHQWLFERVGVRVCCGVAAHETGPVHRVRPHEHHFSGQ
jgi:hypothetical protein